MDPSMLSLDDVTLFDNDYQHYLRQGNDENPRQYFEDDDDPEDFMEDENVIQDFNRRESSRSRRRASSEHQYFGNESSDEYDEETSSDDDETPRINGVPLNNTGPRTPSHNEIHEQITNCLKSSKNLLVECPAVLKRRFKILTGVLDYWQWKKGTAPSTSSSRERNSAPTPAVIYFATRNFAESEAVANEIREHFTHSGHLNNMKITILAHRKNLCINEEIKNGQQNGVDCACLRLSRNFNINLFNSSRGIREEPRPTCEYYSNTHRPREQLFSFVEQNDSFQTVHDIEDFISHGQLTSQCPYYDAKQIHSEADFVICPQEFIISPLLRKEYNISLQSSILIFDDGFNIENICYEEGSTTVSLSDLGKFGRMCRGITGQTVRPDLAALIERLAIAIEELSTWIQENVDENPLHGEILEALRTHDFSLDQSDVESLISVLQDMQTNPSIEIRHPEHMFNLRKFLYVVSLAMSRPVDYFLKVTRSPQSRGDSVAVLQINLTNPGALFVPVEDPCISVVVGASCLAPFKTFDQEFGVSFQEKVKIEQDDEGLYTGQFFAYCQTGPTGMTFKLNYASRGDPKVIQEVGESILQICQKVPGGVIVFFHTDNFFKKVMSTWRTLPSTILNDIQRVKHVISEQDMTTPERTDTLIANFREQSRITKSSKRPQNGALLLALRRGKVFDLLESFRGAEKRAIIHVSIPYAAWYLDQLIMAKRFLFEERHGISAPQENHDWYESEAFRKLNQSFNHSVQDKEWGIVVVLDNRMHSRRHEFDNLLPTWVKNRFRRHSFSRLIQSIGEHVAAQELNQAN